MDDEAWAASQAKKRVLQDTAKNPPDKMTVFRMQGGSPSGSLGIHWTTDPNVAHHTGLGGQGERHVHRGIVSRDQVMTEGQWVGNNIRSFQHTPGGITTAKSQWGLPSEAEVRLRPGSTVREHAVAPAGVHEYAPSGATPTIEARGNRDYIDLAHHAVQGTPEARRLHDIQGALPHVQQSMFDAVHERSTGRELGHVPKWEYMEGDFNATLDQHSANLEHVVRNQGADYDKWDLKITSGSEPPLSDLRQRSRQQEFHGGHARQKESLF